MASNISHIRIRESVDNPDLVEVPLEKDGTLLLSTLIGQYPCSAGLRCKSSSGAWRGLRCTGNVIHPPADGWGDTDYFVVLAKRYDKGGTTSEESSLKRMSQNGGGPVSKCPRTAVVPRDEKPPQPTDDTPAQKAFQARLEIVQERWRRANGPSEELVAMVAEFSNKPKDRVTQTLREPGVNYGPVEPHTRGFHILVKQGLTRLLGRGKVVDEAIKLLKRYHYQITGGEPVRFEYKQLDNDENNTLLFIETDMADPGVITDAVYRDMLQCNCTNPVLEVLKCWIKFLPVHKTCTSNVEDIVAAVKEAVEPVFQSWGNQRGLTFQMQVKGNNYLFRQLKFEYLHEYLVSRGVEQECWSPDSLNAIFIRYTETICFVSLLRNNKAFDAYTVSKIFRERFMSTLLTC